MLSKEVRIENAKNDFKYMQSGSVINNKIKDEATLLLEYIKELEIENAGLLSFFKASNRKLEQLETDKQKLIEKLEERRKQNNNRYGQAIDNDEFPEMYEYSGQVQEDD